MKKFISVMLVFILIAGCFYGCNNKDNQTNDESEKESEMKKLSIVTTIFPEYDWVMQILGAKAENADVTMLLDSGVDLHSYQPTADDIIKISNCDLFIYVGGESDEWAESALKEAVNQNMTVINLLDVLGNDVKQEEVVEGMEAESEEEAEGEDEVEYDEHVWLSLKNAKVICNYIKDALMKLDEENKDTYAQNAEAYIKQLDALDTEYQQAVSTAKTKTLVFADRFPFRYLTDDYGLSYYAAFVGCSAESEASFETIAFLAKKVDQLGLSCVMTLEGSDQKIAQTVVSTTASKSAKILSLNSMQSITAPDVQSGANYLEIMEKNLSVLKEALQ
ncbi:MAG: metal ABC transporter substrate-binding protein [Acutalibacteraceae bacterium]